MAANSTTTLVQSLVTRRAADIVALVERDLLTVPDAVARVRDGSTLGPESWRAVITLAANQLPQWPRCPECNTPSATGNRFATLCAACAQSV